MIMFASSKCTGRAAGWDACCYFGPCYDSRALVLCYYSFWFVGLIIAVFVNLFM